MGNNNNGGRRQRKEESPDRQWLASWLAGWLGDHSMTRCLVGWLVGWLAGWLGVSRDVCRGSATEGGGGGGGVQMYVRGAGVDSTAHSKFHVGVLWGVCSRKGIYKKVCSGKGICLRSIFHNRDVLYLDADNGR